MTRDETVALFLECEAKRAAARAAALGNDEIEALRFAHEAAKAHWNAWANSLLAERKTMEADGSWAVERDFYWLEPKNEQTKAWISKASANFSGCLFLERGAEGSRRGGGGGGGEEKIEHPKCELPSKSIQLEEWFSDFQDFVFPGNIDFQGAKFVSQANFRNTTFSAYANFQSATFSGDADFQSATFCGNADFPKATFSGTANFESAAFSGYGDFKSAAFSDLTVFESATFSSYANFPSAVFSGIANFSMTAFNYANFQGAAFSGRADFGRTTFGPAYFSSAAFSGDTNFGSATFSGDASFQSATFSGGARFESATFSGGANFESATFTGDARFKSATFTGDARFESATFTGHARFGSATFAGDARFGSATFTGDARFKSATFQNFTSFGQAKFQTRASFTGIKVERAFDMTGAKFEKVPAFNQADFKQSPDLDAVDFPLPSFWRGGEAGLIPHYRAIRRMAIQGADYEREQMAFKGETRSKRGTEHKPLHTAFWFGIAYDALSDYGRSIARPLAIWLASAIAFAAIYAWNAGVAVSGWGSACTDDGASKALKALTLSAANSLPLIGSSRSEVAKEFYASCLALPHQPAWSPILQIWQTLWSAVLLFLFLLALRNQFKIK
jgi:hypothetical protein